MFKRPFIEPLSLARLPLKVTRFGLKNLEFKVLPLSQKHF
ncbi:hypothetical protein HHE03_02920 [Helicobacter heilmannii]|nr:hypothetical protein HHE03_02920 [Helicobacter heilmannii]